MRVLNTLCLHSGGLWHLWELYLYLFLLYIQLFIYTHWSAVGRNNPYLVRGESRQIWAKFLQAKAFYGNNICVVHTGSSTLMDNDTISVSPWKLLLDVVIGKLILSL